MSAKKEDRAQSGTQRLYGIGEWYGRLFTHLSVEDRRSFARIQKRSKVSGGKAQLVRYRVHYTTLERSVDGLTAGIPTDLPAFEKRILAKLQKRQSAS